MGHKDLRLGQIVYILVFYNLSFSWLLPLDGFQFNFLLRDSENDLLFSIMPSRGRLLSISVRPPLMLHGTIGNDDLKRNAALQHCCDIISNGCNIVPTLLRCVALKS